MPSSIHERSTHERETLLFSNPESAQRFKQNVGEKLQQKRPGIDDRREIVAAAVAEEFAQVGEGVTAVREPWLHTKAEHEEVQQLVNVAFAQDLTAALKAARQSPHYPRNLDLLHDVLTGEMYEALKTSRLNRQPLVVWLLAAGMVILLGLLGILLLLILASR